MLKIGALTSGGDAPGMNAALRAIVRNGIFRGVEIFAVQHGFQGLINNQFTPMQRGSVADIIQRGGTVLQTARCEEFRTPEGRARAAKNLRENNISSLIIIGGDGSFRGGEILQKEQGIKVIGIPATIDNDIGGTDFCIGFDTAVNTVIDAVNKIRDTATSHERIFVVEIMGRERGFLALYAGLAAGAESILIPERPTSLEDICNKLDHGFQRGKKHSIIMVAEGVGGDFYPNRALHKTPAYALGEAISDKMGLETRVIVLGHLQRGGAPSARDRILASRMGAFAVDLLCEDKSGLITGMVREEMKATSIGEALSLEPEINDEILQLSHILSL